MISAVIPFKGEFSKIEDVLYGLYSGVHPDDLEIIIVNDGSKQTNTRFRPLDPAKEFSLRTQRYVKVINNPHGYGVGYSFDRGVEQAAGDIIVLMGADVYVQRGWYEKVRNAINRYPNTLNGTCCVGDKLKHYGAELLFTVGIDDLPPKSPLRGVYNYSELFKGKWIEWADTPQETCEIPCLMGAFYFTTRNYYNLLGGWDTMPDNKNRGHSHWGSLEPYISLKSWLVGGGVTLHPAIEVRHEFGRYNRFNKWDGGVRGADYRYWNQLFIMETQILDDGLRERLSDFLYPRLTVNMARQRIKRNYDQVLAVRELNRQKFKNTPDIFTERFNYKLKT